MKTSVRCVSIIASFGLLASGLAFANDGVQVVDKAQSQGIQATQVGSADEDVSLMLENYVRSLGLTVGNEPKGDDLIIIQIGAAATSIEAYDENFFQARELLAVEAQLQAKSNIITAISSSGKALGEVVKPNNPVMQQIQASESKYREALASAESRAQAAQTEAQALLKGVDDAQADLIAGAGFGDKLLSLLDATIKKIDENYDPSAIDQAKKEKLENMVKRARQAEAAAAAARAEVKAKEQDLVDLFQREVKAGIDIFSEMPLFGATVIQSVDRYDDAKGELEVAVALVWSTKLHREAKRVYLRQGKMPPNPKRLSLDEYLDTQDLAVMVGPRRYVSKDGSMNFMGISAAAFPSDPALQQDARIMAESMAKRSAVLSLKSESLASVSAEQARRDSRDLTNGGTDSEYFSNLALRMSEKAEFDNLAGLSIKTVRKLRHPTSGKQMYVAVAYVDMDLASKSEAIMRDAYAQLKEFNAADSFRKGQQQGMKAAAETTRNNDAIIGEGRAAGASAVNSQYEESRAKSAQRSNATSVGGGSASSSQGSSGTSGTFMNRGTIERDF